MMVQQFIVILLFLAAAGYMGWRVWKSLTAQNKGGCSKGCGCSGDTPARSV